VDALVGDLVAEIVGAADRIGAVDGRAGLAVERGVAGLGPVAEGPVVTERIIGRLHALVGGLVAGVDGAGDPIGAVDRRAGLAVERRVARLDPVAEGAVVAERVARRVGALIGSLVAGVDGAGDAI
jgi:hypothetical protein